ncbi:MAG TPA: amidohydrolase family protein, partial [Gemmatimonadales bacterium]
PAAAVRTLVRSHPELRLIVTHADRPFIEEVHFGSTPTEAARIWWDICWIWGPPEDHLQTLLATIGAARFLFGTGQPLRIPENGVAKLDLLDLSAEDRNAIEAGNAAAAAAKAR